METILQIENWIAAIKSRPSTDSRQQRIEHLQRLKAQIVSADKREARRDRIRALIILGSAVENALETVDGPHVRDWLRDCIALLQSGDRAKLHAEFPRLFKDPDPFTTGSDSMPRVASRSKETSNE